MENSLQTFVIRTPCQSHDWRCFCPPTASTHLLLPSSIKAANKARIFSSIPVNMWCKRNYKTYLWYLFIKTTELYHVTANDNLSLQQLNYLRNVRISHQPTTGVSGESLTLLLNVTILSAPMSNLTRNGYIIIAKLPTKKLELCQTFDIRKNGSLVASSLQFAYSH